MRISDWSSDVCSSDLMSGDVFGNCMLLSRHIRLVAAFDHRHIFIDPAPDASRSFSEREHLFKLPRSSWDDYDRSLISAGGGIYPRSLTSITLRYEVLPALGIDPELSKRRIRKRVVSETDVS